jgi:hypothetical protein
MKRGFGLIGRALVAAAVACVVLATAGSALAKTKVPKSVSGTVVHANKQAGSFVVATRKGQLFAVHASQLPSLGSRVSAAVRRLSNGTFAAMSTRSRKAKGSSRVRAHGVVSHANASAGTFTLSGAGFSMLVKARSGHALPRGGVVVTVEGTVTEEDEGEIDEETMQEEGEDHNGFDLEGKLVEVNVEARTLKVTSFDAGSCDEESNGEDSNDEGSNDEGSNDTASGDEECKEESVIVHVPAGFEISKFVVGEMVELNVKPLEGGGFELLGSSSDEGEQGADDEEDRQGEQNEEDD